MTTGPDASADATAAAAAAQGAAVKPSQLAITKMLAEAEVARRRALRPWLVSLLLPLLLGAALIGFSSYAVSVRLAKLKELDRQITANQGKIEEQKRELAALNVQLAGANDLASAALSKLPNAEAKEVIAAAAESNPDAAITPRVFIQIYDEAQRGKARELTQALKDSGFIVPGIERRPEKVNGNQVKFFRQEDKEAADKAASVLAGQGVAAPKPVFVGGVQVPPGQIEVWFAPAAPKPTPTPADAGMSDVQKRVRFIIGLTTARDKNLITSDNTLESLGVDSAKYMTYIRQRITLEFHLGSELPDFTPKTTVGDIERLVYERTSKKAK